MDIRLFAIGLNFFVAVLCGVTAARDMRKGYFGGGVYFLFLMMLNIYCMMNGLMALEVRV